MCKPKSIEMFNDILTLRVQQRALNLVGPDPIGYSNACILRSGKILDVKIRLSDHI